jgi:hypothetical protein
MSADVKHSPLREITMKKKIKTPTRNLKGLMEKDDRYIARLSMYITGGLCCSWHWPVYWDTIEKYLIPDGHIEEHGETVIQERKRGQARMSLKIMQCRFSA